MDDLELLRRFRADVASPDPELVARARRRMFEDPNLHDRELRGVRRDRRSRRWLGPAVVAAAVAVAVAVPVVLPGGHSGGAPSAAAQALMRASLVASRQARGDGPPAPGQYVYTKTESLDESDWADAGPNHEGFSVLMPRVREAWIGTDGSGRLLETTGTPTFLSEKDRTAWIASGRPDLGANQTSNEAYQAGGLSYMDLSKLPTDPEQLGRMIERRQIEGGPPGDAETFTIIADMLRETYAPPKLRAALYQIASELPGVELLGTVDDSAGREGVAVAYTNAGSRHELIFDPNTSWLLGERYVVTDPARAHMAVPAGTVVGWATYLASGVVDSTTARP